MTTSVARIPNSGIVYQSEYAAYALLIRKRPGKRKNLKKNQFFHKKPQNHGTKVPLKIVLIYEGKIFFAGIDTFRKE